MNEIAMKGAEGRVMYGYHPAATLSSWSLSGNILTAHVVKQDAFAVTQQPLTFQVTSPKGYKWTWKIQSLQITGQSFQATVDP